MSKKNLILIATALILGAIYVFKFTDWFQEKHIQILYRARNSQLFFGLADKQYRLTQIKVVKADEANTNKYARAVWHLVAADQGSAPIEHFAYGEVIQGMKPAIPDLTPEPLSKNTSYRIFVEAGKLKGQQDFTVK